MLESDFCACLLARRPKFKETLKVIHIQPAEKQRAQLAKCATKEMLTQVD